MSGEFKTVDGNTAAAHVAYAFNEVAAIYPITPSSNMGEYADEWAAKGRKNMFGLPLKVVELQSEAGAAGAVHGSLSAGSLTTTFTASQGLMLMLPNMHKIAGELLPTVFFVSARALACQSLSIYGDHSDIMAARNTGFAMLGCSSVQEVMDLSIVAHLATLKGRVPFVLFFDGFRTSHELAKIEMVDYETIASLVEQEYIDKFRTYALNPEKPFMKVGAQNPDVYFQGREISNDYYTKLPGIVNEYMQKVGKAVGRSYKLFDYYGHPKADKLIIAMASANETIEETVNTLVAQGQKVGALKIRLYRPFDVQGFLDAIPPTVERIAVLDRTKEPGSIGEPLFLDCSAALAPRTCKGVTVIGGRYGLSSKEFTPTMVKAVYDHLAGKNTHNFTVGINDDRTHLSLKIGPKIHTEKPGVVSCKFWGYGSDGTVGANKNSIKIIGENTKKCVQGYFQYDSKKSGGITISHLRFSDHPIQSQYLLEKVDFVALHKTAYIGQFDILENVCDGATLLINSEWPKEEVFEHLTADMQKTIIDLGMKVYNINAVKIAREVGLRGKISTVMQTAFFQLSKVIPADQAINLIKAQVEKSFKKKGDDIVKMNWNAIDQTIAAIEVIEVPKKAGKSVPEKALIPANADAFMKNIIKPIMQFKGDLIPVSAMTDDGIIPTGTSKLEKRGIATLVPKWTKENCIQCTFCSMVCPHATIRGKQILPADLAKGPAGFEAIKSNVKNDKDYQFRIQVYVEDCTGCESCANTCPGKAGKKALAMIPHDQAVKEGEIGRVDFFESLPYVTEGTDSANIKGSQMLRPYFEFHGACEGCGETPYIKLATQLFGDRMIIANATGCTSIYGGTYPTIPYCKDDKGRGPAWANSLFEDNAEFGFGMRLAVDNHRNQLAIHIKSVLETGTTPELAEALKKAQELWDSTEKAAKDNADQVRKLLPAAMKKADKKSEASLKRIIEFADYIVDRSVWCIGGDGWAYDIGYGGLDHVIASGENINLLVLDTEVYSNTGGQCSKSTPTGAVARFAEAGKQMSKKDLALIAMQYGYVYVATLSMGANMAQTLRAIREAESYKGPSLLICYSPCINHGVDMTKPMDAMKRAVDSGYWPLLRYDPRLAKEGKNPLQFDSPKTPKIGLKDYILQERRFTTLKNVFPDKAEALFTKAEENSKRRFDYVKKLSEMQ